MRIPALIALIALTATTASSADLVHPALESKVTGWQAVASGDLGKGGTALASSYQKLRGRFVGPFELSDIRLLASKVQRLSRKHYRSEVGDSWPTLAQVLESGGDDCDGLELLAYWTLRDAGEPVWRAVFLNADANLAHAVTLWGDPADPYVLDPTGLMSKKVQRLSFFKSWKIVARFN